MDFYRSLSDTADRPSIATPAVIERNVYNLKAAPLTDVMYERLEYLICQSDGDCPPGGTLRRCLHYNLLQCRAESTADRLECQCAKPSVTRVRTRLTTEFSALKLLLTPPPIAVGRRIAPVPNRSES
jgi:hypothetical protein